MINMGIVTNHHSTSAKIAKRRNRWMMIKSGQQNMSSAKTVQPPSSPTMAAHMPDATAENAATFLVRLFY
ncbi:MAG: hypothetical protein KC877_04105 [Candidatus Kaiserbacteria bacterium]|nr:hypothetical protein [Candidatus Kaiserbacteria bacterium]MCB9815804.1 hypothetical protein [Candidatus Nomurabacteria bacterium]